MCESPPVRPLGFASARRLAGNQAVASRRVPIEIGLRPNPLGTDYMFRERLRLYKTAGVTMIRAVLRHGRRFESRFTTLARLIDLVRYIDAEGHTHASAQFIAGRRVSMRARGRLQQI